MAIENSKLTKSAIRFQETIELKEKNILKQILDMGFNFLLARQFIKEIDLENIETPIAVNRIIELIL